MPYFKIFTDELPANVGGDAYMCRVRIKTRFRNDAGILAHEEAHVMQWYAGLAVGVIVAVILALSDTQWASTWSIALALGAGLHPLTYTLVPRYRLWTEVAAYRIQAAHYTDDRRHLFATFIAKNYNLSISEDTAEEMLRRL